MLRDLERKQYNATGDIDFALRETVSYLCCIRSCPADYILPGYLVITVLHLVGRHPLKLELWYLNLDLLYPV